MDQIYIPASEYRAMVTEEYQPCQWRMVKTAREFSDLGFDEKILHPYITMMDDRLRSIFQSTLEVSSRTLIIEEEVATLDREELLRQHTVLGNLNEAQGDFAAGTPVMVILADEQLHMFAQVGGPQKF